MNVLRREQIKDRMIRLAATHWNVPENEIDANFDPLVMLMFDAVAAEIEAVGYQIRDIQNTLLNELSDMMLPQALLRARPASCILTAQPSEAISVLNKENNFSTTAQTQKTGEPVKEAELNFTSIGAVKLYKAIIGFLRIGDKTFKFLPDGRKVVLQDDSSAKEMVNDIHFTIHPKNKIESLDGMQLFFDLRSHSEASHFYFALQNAQLIINHQPVFFAKGYYKNDQYEPDIKDAFNKEGDYSRKIQKEIAAIYASQFITIGDTILQQAMVPHAICKGLPEKAMQEIDTPHVLYCTLRLSRPFEQEVLERLQMGVNAFPAINRRLEVISYKTGKWVNIIPLPVNGSYLDVHSISGLGGAHYKIQPNAHDGRVDDGEAIVRTARVGKKSSREVRYTIKSLLEAIRDESAYFSRTSNDFITGRLTEISRILTRLEDQMQLSKDEKPVFRYVLLRAKNTGENVQVFYWTTSPDEAHFVKAGAAFRPVQHTLTEVNQIHSLTAAVGGVDLLSDYAQKQLLVRQLSSRGKIISVEDVKLLCYELFGNKLKYADVQKKMKIPPGQNSGITRVISITLGISHTDYTENELTYLQKQLSYQLDTHAGFMFPFEVDIVEV